MDEERQWHAEQGGIAAIPATARRMRDYCFALALVVAAIVAILWWVPHAHLPRFWTE